MNIHMHRITCPPCQHDHRCDQGRACPARQPAEACTEVGADTRPAALSMTRHNRTAGRVALLLIAAPAVAAVIGVASFIAQHLG